MVVNIYADLTHTKVSLTMLEIYETDRTLNKGKIKAKHLRTVKTK